MGGTYEPSPGKVEWGPSAVGRGRPLSRVIPGHSRAFQGVRAADEKAKTHIHDSGLGELDGFCWCGDIKAQLAGKEDLSKGVPQSCKMNSASATAFLSYFFNQEENKLSCFN